VKTGAGAHYGNFEGRAMIPALIVVVATLEDLLVDGRVAIRPGVSHASVI
jgi:hypothetical protein